MVWRLQHALFNLTETHQANFQLNEEYYTYQSLSSNGEENNAKRKNKRRYKEHS